MCHPVLEQLLKNNKSITTNSQILNLSLQVLLVDLLWNSSLFLVGLGHWPLPDPLLAAVGLGLAACALDLVASAAAIWGNLL